MASRAAPPMMVARPLVAVVAGIKGEPSRGTTNVTLVLPMLKQTGDRKGRVAVPVFPDPLSWYFVNRHSLHLVDRKRFKILDLDLRP